MNMIIEDGFLPKTEQLIITKGVNICADQRVLDKILHNFKTNKDISVYVAAGRVGTGKSSHQTLLVKRLSGNLADTSAPFDVVEAAITYTQGAWVYPYPLYSPNHPNVQILVIDLEGMDGLKDQNIEDTTMNLLKIYLFGMLVSSAFTVHVEKKVDGATVEVLKKAFDICRSLRAGLNIEPPKIHLLLRDIDSNISAQTLQKSREFIDHHLAQYQLERNQLVIKGRGKPHLSFMDSLARDCTHLEGTSYLAVVDELIGVIGQNPKMDPTLVNSPIRLQGLVNLARTACDLLNDKDFEKNLITAIDYIKLEKLNEIYTSHLERCVNESIEKAKTNALTISIEDFKAQVEEYASQCIFLFEHEVLHNVNLSVAVRNWTEKHKGIFRATTKSMGAVELFARRKIAAEENEELRKQHQDQLDQQMELTQKAKECAENLQNQIIKLDQEHREEMARSQQQHDEKIRKLAQETMEEMKNLKDRNAEQVAEHKKKLDELTTNYQSDLIKYEKQLTDRMAQIEMIENDRKADSEKHTQAIQQLKEEYKGQLDQVGQEAEAKRREIEAKIHARELAWTREKHERDLKHRDEMQKIQTQLNEVKTAKNDNGGGLFSFITGIVTKPLQELAMGIVKAFKF